jgi:hypothetical protein
MKCFATELGINLLFMPPGLTDELQPLDQPVFGVITVNCRRLYRANAAELGATNKQIATAFLGGAWEVVGSEVLNDT